MKYIDYRIKEEFTTNSKGVVYIPEVRCRWFIFKWWATFHDNRFPPSREMRLECATLSEALRIIEVHKLRHEEVKMNVFKY